MRHDELMAEFAPKAAAQAQERANRPVAAHAQGQQVQSKKKRKQSREAVQPIPVVHVGIETRAEVYEALMLLTGGNVVIKSIDGGKAKKGVNNGNDR